MDITITSQQIIAVAALIGAVTAIWAVVSKPFKTIKDISDKLTAIDATISTLSHSVEIQGDMVYQLLDHAATNNNTGEMKRALSDYSAAYRHGGKSA